MSGDNSSNDRSGPELSRRTFTKAAGVAAGAGLFGATAGTAGAEHTSIDKTHYANFRVQELAKVWERGYRGQADRTIGLTDSGLDARHPDLGPWNGMQIVDDGGTFRIVDPSKESTKEKAGVEEIDSGMTQAGPGVFVTDQQNDVVVHEFTSRDSSMYEIYVDAQLSWSPPENDLEFRLDKKVDGGWEQVERTATASQPEKMSRVKLQPDTKYRFVAEKYANTVSEVQVTGERYELISMGLGDDDGDVTDENPFSYVSDSVDTQGAEPKCVGWADPGSRFGNYDAPRDPDGHGTHCASIMGGSGRASAFDQYETEEYGPKTLRPGSSETYYVEAEKGQGVFASAYGENLEIEISRPFQGVIASSSIGSDTSTLDNNVVSVPVDEHLPSGYEEGDSVTFQIDIRAGQPGERQANSNVGVGRLEKAARGTLADPKANDSDRLFDIDDDGELEDPDGAASLHSGVAPNVSLIGLQGFSEPTALLAKYPGKFTEKFGLRSVNMSWGYVGGLPLGGLGQGLDGGVVADIKTMAENGILTVAAAGNAATPANGNGAPAVADEAISVVATDPRDGITSYSSGGIGGNDEDGEGTYMKPDVTAPGGSLPDLVQAAKAGSADTPESKQTIRGYTGKAGTSMASPYTNGVAGLVAQAMEEDAPDSIALAAPDKYTDEDSVYTDPDSDIAPIDDVQRLKQVILATASETALTAAPYHEAKAPTYQFGGRDPFEGYGRVNPDAAVDAVSRDLFNSKLEEKGPGDGLVTVNYDGSDSGGDGSKDILGRLGLDVPKDSRAVAGYVDPEPGELTVTLDAPVDLNTDGSDAGMASAPPHIDLFVYDAEQPSLNGEPNVVAKASTRDGQAAQVKVKTDGSGFNPFTNPQSQVSSGFGTVPEPRPLIVVAKLVNVPGLVNGFDYQVDLTGKLEMDINPEPKLPLPEASGDRDTNGTEFLAGESKEVRLTVRNVEAIEGTNVSASVWDQVPNGWTVPEAFDYEGEVRQPEEGGPKFIKLGEVSTTDLGDGGIEQFTYAAEAPNENGQYQFGPAYVEIADQGEFDDDGDGDVGKAEDDRRGDRVTIDGTDYRVIRAKDTNGDGDKDTELTQGEFTTSSQNIVLGGTNTSGSQSGADSTLDEGTDTVTDGVSDATGGSDGGSSGGSSGGSDDGSITDGVTGDDDGGSTVGDAVETATSTTDGTL